MKKYTRFKQAVLILLASLFVWPSAVAVAAAEVPPPVVGPYGLQTDSPVIITELQTGSSSLGKSDEFIELYNAGDDTVDITGWQVRYVNASNETATPTLIAAIAGTGESSRVILPSQAYFVLHTPSVGLPAGALGQVYDAKLSNADKAIMLLRPDADTCEYSLEDSVGWGTATKAEGPPPQIPAADKNAERFLQRYRDPNGFYLDTNQSAQDTKVTAAVAGSAPNTTAAAGSSIGSFNIAVLPLTAVQAVASPPVMTPPLSIANCTIPDPAGEAPANPPLTTAPATEPPASITSPPADTAGGSQAAQTAPVFPAGDVGLASPQLTEILPNPAAPQTDATDEFIELYNPNAVAFDLSGFSFEVGATAKRRYSFPVGTQLPGLSFKAFFSADTRLSLSNSGSEVRLLDPFGNPIATADAYGTAKDGQAWARANGVWAWTTTPTPNAANVVTRPVAAASKKTAAAAPKNAKQPAAGSTKKAAKTKQPATTKDAVSVASLTPDTPLHTGILAGIGVVAVLYGAYEYRHDLANYLYRLRSYRRARRADRPAVEGRRGD